MFKISKPELKKERNKNMLKNKPVLGWNTWNTFGYDINEELILTTVDAFIEKGYKDAGYEYIIIDDCWSLKERDAQGRLQPDPERFPHGMKYVADYIHSKGLKFGMYSDCGFWTCAGYPGSYGYEYIDAKTFAEWEVDYLKYDYGFFPETANTKNAYLTMAQALRNSGRDILLAACNWGVEEPWKWMRSRGADTYRSTHDIEDSTESFIKIFKSQCENFENSASGCYNDLDMLTVGMFGGGFVSKGGSTFEEYQMHFAMWAFLGTPLIIGGDIRNMDERCKELLQNKELIRINQDADNRPAFRVTNYYDEGYAFCRLLENGEVALFICSFHDNGKENQIMVSFDDIGVRSNSGYGVEITDVMTGENLGIKTGGIAPSLKYNDFRVYRGKIVKL